MYFFLILFNSNSFGNDLFITGRTKVLSPNADKRAAEHVMVAHSHSNQLTAHDYSLYKYFAYWKRNLNTNSFIHTFHYVHHLRAFSRSRHLLIFLFFSTLLLFNRRIYTYSIFLYLQLRNIGIANEFVIRVPLFLFLFFFSIFICASQI